MWFLNKIVTGNANLLKKSVCWWCWSDQNGSSVSNKLERRIMFQTEIWLPILSITMLGTLVMLCVCCGSTNKKDSKKNSKKSDKHDRDYKLNKKLGQLYLEGNTGHAEGPLSGYRDNQEFSGKDNNIEPRYVNAAVTDLDSEEAYIDPISSDYYNFDFGRASVYGNVFNSHPCHLSGVYENAWTGKTDVEIQEEDHDYIDPDDM
ncbi:uncharacterized protein LOC108708353 [Xenopus laevis]|uniref:Uncharacterized protein LOC108708353 n=1 Tax=Xenopus laevis TaxID=8355 RepID=A0A8J1M996_XENLA|nr:uncharacterized protein LOC108708353 [Xenopus laevis]